MNSRWNRVAQIVAWPLMVVGCAAPVVDAQWRSVELLPAYLRGATVALRCEGGDEVLRRICEDRVSAELAARGATPVRLVADAPAQTGVVDMQYLPAARERNAKALVSVGVGASSSSVSPGVMVSIGGFGVGSHSGGGVGVAAPLGGGQLSNGYTANARITDVATGRLMWTARASTPPSSDVNAQLAELARTLWDAAAQAGMF